MQPTEFCNSPKSSWWHQYPLTSWEEGKGKREGGGGVLRARSGSASRRLSKRAEGVDGGQRRRAAGERRPRQP